MKRNFYQHPSSVFSLENDAAKRQKSSGTKVCGGTKGLLFSTLLLSLGIPYFLSMLICLIAVLIIEILNNSGCAFTKL